MHHVREEKLPFVGSSYEFVGAEQGDTGVSVFLFYETSLSSKLARFTASRRLAICRWCNSTSTSALGSFKRTCDWCEHLSGI